MGKILLADDEAVNRLLLQTILESEGFDVIAAENGLQAVEKFDACRPDLVLMDIFMPVMDGYEATRRIKAKSRNDFVPVIFLTAANDEEIMVKCVESGGDDFLTKPYSNILLRSRIAAFLRISDLYGTVQRQHQELVAHQGRLDSERQLARRVFTNIVDSASLDLPIIRSMVSPASQFSGGLILVAQKPSGGIHIMLGNFGDHGLAAATAALPVSGIFYSMTEKGYSIGEVVAEINSRLHKILPDGMSLAACVMNMNPITHTASIWNGGIPLVLIHSQAAGGVLTRVESGHPALGLVEDEQFDRQHKVISMQEGDRVYLACCDVSRLNDGGGGMIWSGDTLGIFQEAVSNDSYFDKICDRLRHAQERGGRSLEDFALMEVVYRQDVLDAMTEISHDKETAPNPPPTTWNMSMTLGADLMRQFDPLPMIMQALTDIQGFSGRRQELYTVFTELFSNALEHGILRLESSLKNTADGFEKYYQQRAVKLGSLAEGHIKIDITHRPLARGGEMVVRVEDSGAGFDFKAKMPELTQNLGNFGRGIQLIRARCVDVRYLGKGNIVEATYRWNDGEHN